MLTGSALCFKCMEWSRKLVEGRAEGSANKSSNLVNSKSKG